MNFLSSNFLPSFLYKNSKKEEKEKIFYIDEDDSNDDIQILLDKLNDKLNYSPIKAFINKIKSFFKKLCKGLKKEEYRNHW